jgi:hypothetical protein
VLEPVIINLRIFNPENFNFSDEDDYTVYCVENVYDYSYL